MIRKLATLTTVGLVLGFVPGSGSAAPACSDPLPTGSEPVTLDPADFVAPIDNPLWPMAVGSTWVSRETDAQGDRQKVVVVV